MVGLFDQQLFVEDGGKSLRSFGPIGGPIPLHRYRSFKKTKTEERIDRIEAIAAKLGLPRAVLAARRDGRRSRAGTGAADARSARGRVQRSRSVSRIALSNRARRQTCDR